MGDENQPEVVWFRGKWKKKKKKKVLQWLKGDRENQFLLQYRRAVQRREKSPLILSCMSVRGLQPHFTLSS